VYPLGKVKQSLATTLLLVLQEKKWGSTPKSTTLSKQKRCSSSNELDPQETAIAEAGAFMYMDHNLAYGTTTRKEEGGILVGLGNLLDGDGC
jgi:hypothetical protein